MSCAVSGSEILEARDARHARLLAALAAGAPSTLFLSLNVVGEEKTPPGAAPLFAWGAARLAILLPGLREVHRATDRLGPFALFLGGWAPVLAKEAAIALEEESPAARLLDLDVYDGGGNPVGRRELGLPPRRCLLCEEAAADCMRLSRHDRHLLRARTDELLHPFRP